MGRALVAFACCTCAFALNPELEVSQYAHTSWKIRDGFTRGVIRSIAQTPDGYLWLGTDFGLLHFDGVRNVPWQPPPDQALPSSFISKVLAARDGTIWIGTREGLASWRSGKLTQYPELARQAIGALLEDHEGSVWAGGIGIPSGRLCTIQKGSVRCYGEDGSFGFGVPSLYEFKGGLWVGATNGLWRWKPDPPKFFPNPDPVDGVSDLIEGDNGALWIAMRGGIRQLVGGKAEPYPLPAGGQFNPLRLLRDREGGLWIGTYGQGLLHVRHGMTDQFTSANGLSGDHVLSLFEDREGNIWVATREGLDRFRDFPVSTISSKEGLSTSQVFSVLSARDGSVWVGTPDGLNRWNDGQITVYRKRTSRLLTRAAQERTVRAVNDSGLPDNGVDSLFQDDRGRVWVSTLRGMAYFEGGRFIPVSSVPRQVVRSMAEEGMGNLWIDDQDYGLIHLLGESEVERIPWAKLGRKDFASALVPDPVEGGLWLGFYQSGLAYFRDAQVRASYGADDGLGHGTVNDLRLDRDGTLWAATDGGLSRLKNGHVTTLTSKNGLPCDAVHWVMEDDVHSVWLYTVCGLVRIARPELDAWAADPSHTIKTSVFDNSDGVRSIAITSGFSPAVSKSPDGKLWFTILDGVSIVDPRHLPFNKLPPPVHIEQITADRNTYETSSNLHLPALVRDLEIDYTALSLIAPEKIRFRVKLEGRDPDWKDVGNERKAFYNDLPPRNYRFRVIASNNSGVWNEAGASLDFSVAAAYYQTRWFQAACAAAFLVLLWALYRFRLHQVAREFNASLEGRVDERLRVARDLHDTLLQSFHGLLPRLQAAVNLLPGRASDARQVLEAAVDDAAHAITEARDAVQDMRSSATTGNDLAKAVEAIGQELAAHHGDATGEAPAFSLEVEGAAQDLHPILRDEIYRISSEALRNSFHHGRARKIEVEIRYDRRQLRVRVRDNGIGIDASVLSSEGRAGHFGLKGMRERAKNIGGQLELWSEHGAGTEVELTVPASVAYAGRAARRFRIFRNVRAKS